MHFKSSSSSKLTLQSHHKCACFFYSLPRKKFCSSLLRIYFQTWCKTMMQSCGVMSGMKTVVNISDIFMRCQPISQVATGSV